MNESTWIGLTLILLAINLIQFVVNSIRGKVHAIRYEQADEERKRACVEAASATQAQRIAHQTRDAAVELMHKAEKLANVHISNNEMFTKQSEDAWKMYRIAGLRAANAQKLMLGEIDKLARIVNKYRVQSGEKPIQMNESYAQIYKDFLRECVAPDPAATEGATKDV